MINPSYENSCRILIESLNCVLFTLDDQGKITCVSDGCSESLGFLPEEMIGRPVSAFVLPEDQVRIGEFCAGGGKQGVKKPFSFPVVSKGGDIHQASVISRSVFEGQEKSGMIGIIGEISTGKQSEKIMLQANAKIHIFNSVVRHDINNKLTVLHGYLSLMEQEDNAVSSSEIVKILLDATDKIHKIVAFTSEYKEIGTHLPVWINLFEAFQSARSTSDAAGIQVTTEPACQDLELFCDPMLTKVFYHLIDNSLRHGKTVSEISLLWRPENADAIIVYGDNGTGIADTVRPTLFQPRKGTQTGYGLFLVHEILAIYGFTITETGSPGKGVRFEIVVPAGSFKDCGKEAAVTTMSRYP